MLLLRAAFLRSRRQRGQFPDGLRQVGQQLYDRVWSTPMRKLALRYGLSDGGLAKLSARHDIPRPQRGYWAKKKCGTADCVWIVAEYRACGRESVEILLRTPKREPHIARHQVRITELLSSSS